MSVSLYSALFVVCCVRVGMFVKLNVVCLHYIDPVLCHQHVSDAVIYCNFTLLIALSGKPNHLCSGKSGSNNSGNSIGYYVFNQ